MESNDSKNFFQSLFMNKYSLLLLGIRFITCILVELRERFIIWTIWNLSTTTLNFGTKLMYPAFKSKEIVFTCLLTFKGNRLKYLLIWYEVLLGKISPVRWLSLSNQIKLILSVDINSSNAMCLGRCSGSDFLCILASSSMIRWTVLSETLKRLPISFNDVLKAVSDKIICLTGCAIWQYSQT